MKKKHIISFIVTFLFMTALIIFSVKQNNNDKTVTASGYYFNTYITITCYKASDEQYLNGCMSLCDRYEQLFSRTVEGSDIYNINNSNGQVTKVNEETYYLLSEALEFCQETDGAIDITVAELMDLWGFNDSYSASTLPDNEELTEVLSHVNYENIRLLDNNCVQVTDPDSKIDLGFIAKGYIADRLKDYLISKGVSKAIISLGGNIYVIGSKSDTEDFVIGIKDPMDKSNVIGKVEVHDTSVVTSGTYERYIEVNGIKYHHILDTKTGYPVDNGINGVTITCESSMYADALSTTCLILGENASKTLLDKYNATAVFY